MVNQLVGVRPLTTHSPETISTGNAKIVLGLAAVAALVLAGGVLSFALFSAPPPRPPGVVTVPAYVPPPRPVQAPKPEGKPKRDLPMGPENLYWLDQYISPVGVDATGDGVEDIAGAFILVENGAMHAYVGVIDGKTFELVWKAGPYGDRKKATRSTGVAVKAGRMLAVNVLGDGIVHDLKTGEQLLKFTFDEEDPARWICAPEEGTSVFFGTSWGGGVLTDLQTLKQTKARAPAVCKGDQRRPLDTGDVWQKQAKNETGRAPKLERFDASCWFHDGKHGVMMGSARGTDAIELIGFDPVKRVETWRQPLAKLSPGAIGKKASAIDLGEGKFFYTWGEDGDRHVVAIDAATGEKAWESASPGYSITNFTISKTRFYAVTLEWDAVPVNVYDLQTGALLARLAGTHSRF